VLFIVDNVAGVAQEIYEVLQIMVFHAASHANHTPEEYYRQQIDSSPAIPEVCHGQSLDLSPPVLEACPGRRPDLSPPVLKACPGHREPVFGDGWYVELEP
jgi:hypothetical protein